MKLPFTLSLKFLFRLLLPGFLLSTPVFPMVDAILGNSQGIFSSEMIFSVCVLILGWLFVILDMQIYMAFEGRRYWPSFVRRPLRKSEERRLAKIQDVKNRFRESDRARYLEACVEERRFPMNAEGDYYAFYPTRLGNLLASYESYPDRVYGMDGVFYWYRIWLSLDDKLREEIDNQQAVADSTTYSAAALFGCFGMCMVYLILKALNISFISFLPGSGALISLAVASLLGGYILNRISIHIHAQFGELFKSIFDQFRNRVLVDEIVEEIETIGGDRIRAAETSSQKYKMTWRYLHNYKIELKNGVKKSVPKLLSE